MKLFLSSQGFAGHAANFLDLLDHKRSILFVDNAKDFLPESQRYAHVAEKKIEFEMLGLDFEELDLRKYFWSDSKKALKNKLASASAVWLSGGNSFILRRALAYSGLDELLLQKIKLQPDFVLGGSSAGAIMACPSLKGVENGDDPMQIPSDYQPSIIWSGLNLISIQIVPHFESDWFGESSAKMVAYYQKHKIAYQALSDQQALLVEGDSSKVLQ